jgi:acyl-CoA thioester hydrolase
MSGTMIEAVTSRRPVTIRRRVRWGECDPAGVVYTPRFADYAVSAMEHFIASLVGDPPQARLLEMRLGLPMKGMAFEFRRSLLSEQDFDMIVRVSAMRIRTFDLQVEGRSLDGESLFLVTMSPICVEPVARKSLAIPAELRQLLEDYQRDFPMPAKD